MSSYRISTAGLQSAAIAQMLKQQSMLAKTQAQVSSGQRIQTPADDPVGATRILTLQGAQSQLTQYGTNAGIASDRLSQGEQAMADLSTVLQRIQELTTQANNGSLDDQSLGSISSELKSRAQDLLAIANRQDSNGEYLFAGYSSGAQPFADSGSGVTYAGDQGARLLQISPSQKVADSVPGDSVFMGITEGNGTFAVDTGVHAGTATIGTQQVVNAGAWVPGNYTVSFTDANADGVADTWQVTNNADTATPPTVIASGNYTDGGAIAFNGAQFIVSGQPAVGDTLQVRPAGKESLFKTVNDLIGALDAGTATPQAQATLGTAINKALAQLGNGLDNVINVRTTIGTRLDTLDSASSLRADLNEQLTTSLSGVKDLDYASAISTLNQQMVGLQAAQAAYTRIGQLSLFDYLR